MNDFTLVREGTVNKKIAVVVFDVLGKIVYKKEISDTYSPIRFGEDFKTGIYFAVVTQGDKQKTVKLIKQ